MKKITVDENFCKGCGLCVAACPKKLMRLSDRLVAKGYHPAECTDDDACISCAICATMCPDCAIKVEKEEK